MQAQLPEWAEVLFDESYRHIAIHGGRGSGKSHSVARALLTRGVQKKLRILCVREIQESIKQSIKQLLDDCIASMELGEFYHSTESEIVGENGTQFIFAGLLRNIDSIKSKEGVDVCWVEEAQSVSQRSIDVLVPTIRKQGSQIIWVWNPTKPDDPVDKMFRKHTPRPDECVREVNFVDNPFFTDTQRGDMEKLKAQDPDMFPHVYLGAYLIRSKANVFHDWHAVNDETAPKMKNHLQPRFGADWGFAQDPTVLIRAWVDNDARIIYVDKEALGIGTEIVDTPALFRTIEDSERWPIIADSSRPETISHMRSHGFPKVMPAVKGPNSVEEGVKFLMGFTIYVHVDCTNTIFEMGAYKRKVKPKTDEILEELEDKNNHSIDALRYAVEGDRRTPVKKLVTVIPPRPIASRW